MKLISLFVGIFSVGLAFLFRSFDGSITRLARATISVIVSPLNIAFLAGIFFPFVNSRGTVVGMVAALAITSFFSTGQLAFKLGGKQSWLPTNTSLCADGIPTLAYTSAQLQSNYTPDDFLLGSGSGSGSGVSDYEDYSLNNSFATTINQIVTQLNKTSETDESNLPPVLEYLFSISFFLYPFISMLIGVAVSVVASLWCFGEC